jgi:Domain of unknown function (DUF4729)
MDQDFDKIPLPSPFKCALTDCQDLITESTLMSHFLTKHQREGEFVEFQDIQSGEKIFMMASIENFAYNKNSCLGILGINVTSIKHTNVLLSQQYEPYCNHTPILIMACRCNYYDLFNQGNGKHTSSDADFVVFWLCSPKVCERKLYAILTIHNQEHTLAVSSSMEVRATSDSQDALQFSQKEINCLVVNAGQLKDIANEDCIYVEIIVSENLM